MKRLRLIYHYLWALASAVWYRFPARKIFVLGVTGTKGKTSTLELISAILEAAGERTAIASTLRFKIGTESKDNLLKMTMPGRGRLQQFLFLAERAGCTYALIEMTSEGAKQLRHRFIDLDALIFTNLAPEHIEAHGSYQNYLAAKLEIVRQLERSRKKDKIIIANGDDPAGQHFLKVQVPNRLTYRLAEVSPSTADDRGGQITISGETLRSPLPGRFNLYNLLAAVTFVGQRGIKLGVIRLALEKFTGIRGRLERLEAQT
ncbi:MAG: Mur ligase family protein, partial [Patescibacteria group bacterium]